MSNEMAEGLRSRMVKTVDWEAPTGEVFIARVPSTAQMMIFFATFGEGSMADRWNAIRKFLQHTFKEEGEFDRVYELIEEGEIDLPDIIGRDDAGDGDTSLISLLNGAISGGRPTSSSDDSSMSSDGPGKRSTGRSRGKGSIPSTSRSTAS